MHPVYTVVEPLLWSTVSPVLAPGEPMPADVASSLVVFVVSSVVVFLDGQIIRAKGRTYLRAVYPNPDVAESINLLIAVLFHLLALGVLALLVAPPAGSQSLIRAIATKFGLALLVVAVSHAAAMLTLSKVRARHVETQLQQHLVARPAHAPSEATPRSPGQNHERHDPPQWEGYDSSDSRNVVSAGTAPRSPAPESPSRAGSTS